MTSASPAPLYGLLAEFVAADDLLSAARAARAAGFRRVEAYTHFPIHGLAEALGHGRSRGVSLLTLLGGIGGFLAACGMMYYASAVSYPLNVGGRPLASWPTYVPIGFELAVLGASLFAFLGMLALNGLPRPYHPVFNVPRFKLASQTHFFLAIEARDPQFELSATRGFLWGVGAQQVYEVEP